MNRKSSKYIQFLLWILFVVSIGDLNAQSEFDPESPPEPGMYAVHLSSNPENCASFEQANVKGLYAFNEEATIQVQPNNEYDFVEWIENGKVVSQSPQYTFKVKGNHRLIAKLRFNPTNPSEPGAGYFNLITSASPEIGGTVQQSGRGLYKPDETVKITASPYPDYEFKHWEQNGEIISTNPEYEFSMPSKRVYIKAIFNWNPKNPNEPGYEGGVLYLIQNNGNAGYISQSGNGVYPLGTKVTLVASPFNGYLFEGWYKGNTLLSKVTTYEYEITERETTIQAKFKLDPNDNGGDEPNNPDQPEDNKIQIGVDGGDSNGGEVNIEGVPIPGQEITITATPKPGYAFEGWYLNGELIEDAEMEHTLLLDNSMKTINAKFVKLPFKIEVEGGNEAWAFVSKIRDQIAHLIAKKIEGYTFDGWYLGQKLLSKLMEYDFHLSSLKASLPAITAKYIKSDATGIENIKDIHAIHVYKNGDILYIQSLTDISNVQVFTFQGVRIEKWDKIQASETKSLPTINVPIIISWINHDGKTETLKVK